MSVVVKAKNEIKVFRNDEGDIVISEFGSANGYDCTNQDYFVCIHPDDLKAVIDALQAAAKE